MCWPERALFESTTGRFNAPLELMNDRAKPTPDSEKTNVPARLCRGDDGQRSEESIREMRSNLVGFFTILEEWKIKAETTTKT